MRNFKHIIFSLLILTICYDEPIATDSSCGDWEPYNEGKCFKIFNKVGLQSYEDAEKTCQQQENGSSLITIHLLEEQEFISNLFKTHKVANDVWIGVKYNNNKYNWNDDSDLVFTNWAQGSPKNKTDHCSQMISDETLFGKWSDTLCNKLNLVVCQKMPTWSLSHLQKLLWNTIKNPFPIGFIYVQLPNEKSPTEIWPWMTWNDVSSVYAGVFFRVMGGESESFGKIQQDNSPHLTNVKREEVAPSNGANLAFINTVKGGSSECIHTGIWEVIGASSDKDVCIRIGMSGGEMRPRNMAIRVWKRTG